MNLVRSWKSLLYPWFPSSSPASHNKRRKGLFYRWCAPDLLECQKEQDRIFWGRFLRPGPGGIFLELGGDGVIGSHTLGLEVRHGWSGEFCEPCTQPQKNAQGVRRCRVVGSWQELSVPKPVDLMALHRPAEFMEVLRLLGTESFRPRWVVVENRDPDPQWCRWLEASGYRMKFFFHDDEYYEFKA